MAPELIDAMEDIVADFNRKQLTNPTIDNCFRKVGQDISCSLKEFTDYLTSLSEEQIYRVLIEPLIPSAAQDSDIHVSITMMAGMIPFYDIVTIFSDNCSLRRDGLVGAGPRCGTRQLPR